MIDKGARGWRRIRVRVPATTSNLGPGFDVLGMALKLYCRLELTVFWPDLRRRAWGASAGPARLQLRVEHAGEGAGELPLDESHLVVKSFRKVLPGFDASSGLAFRVVNDIPVERGLGSSAAARLCGLLAAGAVAGRGKELAEDLVEQAVRLEGHPDNAIPAFHGGLRVCARDERGRLVHFPLRLPRDLGAVVCIPDFPVATELARRALPAKIPHADAVRTASRLALLIGAFERGEYSWLRGAMEDVLHQPYRKRLVPGLDAVIAEACRAGAFGAALSGSGSAVFALALRGAKQAKIGRAMQKAFLRFGHESRYLALDPDPQGARVEVE